MNPWIITTFVLILMFQDVSTAKETPGPCLYNSSCFLSCKHTHGKATILHWQYMTGVDQKIVHSFYYGKDQFEHQDPRFKNRTSLAKDAAINTTLHLKNVKVQDEGKYKCSTDSEGHGWQSSFYDLQVDAPVQRVEMVIAGNSATCSSEGVYPKPKLTWSSSTQPNTTVQPTEEKLYNISSSLKLSDMDGDLPLSCTVSTRFNKWTTTWMKPLETHTSRAQISCSYNNTSFRNFSMVWSYNHTDVIMRWSRTDGPNVSSQWKKHVEADKVSDVLHLRDLSSDQEGTYSCELSTAEETTVTHTLLRVDIVEMKNGSTGAIVGGVILSLIIIIIVVLVVLWKCCCPKLCQKSQPRRKPVSNNGTAAEMKAINGDAATFPVDSSALS